MQKPLAEKKQTWTNHNSLIQLVHCINIWFYYLECYRVCYSFMVLLQKVSQFYFKLHVSNMTNKQIPGPIFPMPLNMTPSLNGNPSVGGACTIYEVLAMRKMSKNPVFPRDFQHLSHYLGKTTYCHWGLYFLVGHWPPWHLLLIFNSISPMLIH